MGGWVGGVCVRDGGVSGRFVWVCGWVGGWVGGMCRYRRLWVLCGRYVGDGVVGGASVASVTATSRIAPEMLVVEGGGSPVLIHPPSGALRSVRG